MPERGEKREIVEMALNNAREQLGRRLAENAAQRELLEGVAELFGLDGPPKRIEVYDNSHIMGGQRGRRHDRRRARTASRRASTASSTSRRPNSRPATITP